MPHLLSRAITPNVRRLGSFGLSSAATAGTAAVGSNPFRERRFSLCPDEIHATFQRDICYTQSK